MSQIQTIKVVFIGALLQVFSFHGAFAKELNIPVEDLKFFIFENCINCHGGEKTKGNLDFNRLSIDLNNTKARDTWQDILVAIQDDEMPPEESPRPAKKEKEDFIKILQSHLDLANKQASSPPSKEEKPDAPVSSRGGVVYASVDQQALKPFLGRYCMDCHGPDKQKGDVRFDHAKWTISNDAEAQRWQDVLDVLNSGDMPPEDKPQPDKESLIKTIRGLTLTLREAEDKLADEGGVYTMRRLNKREYLNTIKYLFGLNVSSAGLPDDSGDIGFDTIGENQYFNQSNIDDYYTVSKNIIHHALAWSPKKYGDVKTQTIEAEGRLNHHKQYGDRYRKQYDHLTGIYLSTPVPTLGGIKIHYGNDPRAEYKLKVIAGTAEGTAEERKFMNFGNAGNSQVFKVYGSIDKPQEINITYPHVLLDPNGSVWHLTENFKPAKARPVIWVDKFELSGPYYSEKENVFGNLAKKYNKAHSNPKQAKSLIKEFTFEAFRRNAPSDEYLKKLYGYYDSLRVDHDYHKAMTDTLAVVMTSPGFLYIEEEKSHNSLGGKNLSARSFANRISYLLWSRPPDKELYELAESGEIHNLSVLRKQVKRMLKDRRSEAFFEGFMSQWADFDRFDAVSISQKDHPHFNKTIRLSAKREVTESFKYIAQNNRPISDLIGANYAVVNAHLADYYGLKKNGNFSNEFEPVKLPENSPRGGFISQLVFLVGGSNGIRSSPVIRGTMILDMILDSPSPPAPPNVPELGSDIKEPLSNREMVKIHQSQPACASCHEAIDPIGFGLENFDAAGRWRTHEKVGDKDVPIENRGRLKSGVTYHGIDELKQLLLTQKHQFSRGFSKKLLEYGTGRPITFSDKKSIQSIVEKSKSSGYLFEDVILHVINSEIFKAK